VVEWLSVPPTLLILLGAVVGIIEMRQVEIIIIVKIGRTNFCFNPGTRPEARRQNTWGLRTPLFDTLCFQPSIPPPIQEEWDNITLEEIKRAIESMPKRVAELNERNGLPMTF
jgi:hypothetical protein